MAETVTQAGYCSDVSLLFVLRSCFRVGDSGGVRYDDRG